MSSWTTARCGSVHLPWVPPATSRFAAGGKLSLQNGASLSGSTAGAGLGGSIRVTANDLAIGPLAAIANVSSGPAPAGDISVNVAGQLSVRGNPAEPNVDARPQTGITSQSLGPGNAGNVAIKAGNLTIVGVAAIGSVVVGSGSGDAGTVSVNVAG